MRKNTKNNDSKGLLFAKNIQKTHIIIFYKVPKCGQ